MLRRVRPGESRIPLHDVAAELQERVELFLRFDAVDDTIEIHVAAERNEGLYDL